MNHRKLFTIRGIWLLCGLMIWLSACAVHSTQVRQGRDLYQNGEYDRALASLREAVKKYPNHSEIKTLYLRARIGSYYHHLSLARRARAEGDRDAAAREYEAALAVFPDNNRLREERDEYLHGRPAEPQAPAESAIQPPFLLQVDTEEAIGIKLNNVPVSRIFKMVGKSFSVNFIFDKDFRDFLYSIEVDSIRFYPVLNQLCLVANARYRVLGPRSILIYPDTPIKKRALDLKGVKVFYLDHIMAEDAKKLIMAMFRDQQIMAEEDLNLNAIIVKASQDTLQEIESFLQRVDKERNEVQLDVEILEVNRNLLNKLGVDFGTTPFTLSAGQKNETTGEIETTIRTGDLSDVNFFLNIPSVALNFLETDDNNKIIAKPNLRGVDGEEIKFMVGDELPIPQTQWQAFAAGGVENTPVTSYQYQNVGVTIQLTPFVHADREVTIQVKFTIKFVTGYLDAFPILGKRELENTIRLREGETSIIGGFLRDEVRGSLSGLPALSKIPVLGRLFGASERTIQQTDVVFSITPRVIRRTTIRPADQLPIWSNVPAGETPASAGEGETQQEERAGPPRRSPVDTVSISPANRRVPLNNTAYFTIRLASRKEITTLALSGSISGGEAEVEELKTDFFRSDEIKVLSNASGDAFDLGYSFFNEPQRNAILAQLKVKFSAKGTYTLTINHLTAYDQNRTPIQLDTASAEVEVF